MKICQKEGFRYRRMGQCKIRRRIVYRGCYRDIRRWTESKVLGTTVAFFPRAREQRSEEARKIGRKVRSFWTIFFIISLKLYSVCYPIWWHASLAFIFILIASDNYTSQVSNIPRVSFSLLIEHNLKYQISGRGGGDGIKVGMGTFLKI